MTFSTKYYSREPLQYYSVLQSTTPGLRRTTCTTKYYSVLQSTTPCTDFITKYYSTQSLLPSTTPVLLCTTKYHSSTTLYYKVLLRHHSVLPVLQSTTLYYKVPLQYYSVLQSTTPVLLRTTCTTKCYSVLLCTKYHSVLCTTPVLLCTTKYHSTLYYKVPLQYCRYSLYYLVLLPLYSVLQSPVLTSLLWHHSSTNCTTKSTPVLLCTAKSHSSASFTTKYTIPALWSDVWNDVWNKARLVKKARPDTDPEWNRNEPDDTKQPPGVEPITLRLRSACSTNCATWTLADRPDRPIHTFRSRPKRKALVGSTLRSRAARTYPSTTPILVEKFSAVPCAAV